MTLFRRKLWGDRATWFVVLVATGAVVNQWITRGGALRLYILIAWAAVVLWLIGYSELRIGRKQLRRGTDAMFLGLAAFVGEEHVDPDGSRKRGWSGAAAGALAFEPEGIRWVPRDPDAPEEISIAWSELYSWRFGGVIPFIWRASGYLLLTLYGGRELVFHIHGLRSWTRGAQRDPQQVACRGDETEFERLRRMAHQPDPACDSREDFVGSELWPATVPRVGRSDRQTQGKLPAPTKS